MIAGACRALVVAVGIAAAVSASAEDFLAPISKDPHFLATIKSITLLRIDDPASFTVLNPMGGVLPLFGAVGGALSAQSDLAKMNQVRTEFTELLKQHEIAMGNALTESLAEKLKTSGIPVQVISASRPKFGSPITTLSAIDPAPNTDAVVDVFFASVLYMAVGNFQDYEPWVACVVRVHRVQDNSLVYQQMFQYSKPVNVSRSPRHPILTAYEKGIAFGNQKAIYDAPDRAIMGFRQGIEPLANRIYSEFLSWRQQ